MNIAWGRGDRLELQADGGELYRSVEQALKSQDRAPRRRQRGYKCDVCKRIFRRMWGGLSGRPPIRSPSPRIVWRSWRGV
jgi:hypothetical protein